MDLKNFSFKTTHLPPHEDIVAAFQGVIVKVVRVETFGIFVKRLKLTLKRNMRISGKCALQIRMITFLLLN